MNRQFVAEQMSTFRRFDRINVADDVGDGHVRSRQLLDEPRVAIDPGNRRRLLMQFDRLTTVGADRIEWIVVNFRTSNDWNLRVKQVSKLPNDAALRLTAQTKQNQVVPGKDRINELRHDGFVVTHDSRKQLFAPLEFADQVSPHLIFD